MSRRIAVAFLCAAVLSGCGVGLHAQTYKEAGRTDSASADLENLVIRNLHVEPPATGSTLAAGSQAELTGALVNHGDRADSLQSVSTDVAASVSFTQDGKPVPSVTVPAGRAAGEWTAVLEGLTAPLAAGTYITVTLTFTDAGRTTLRVPVHIGDAGLGSREVIQEPYGEGG